MSNQAAWITKAKANPLEVGKAEYNKPGKGEVLIKNGAVAINPVDWQVQDYGFIITEFPNVLGEDIAGEVVETGEGVERFKKGDRVISHTRGLLTNKPEHGAFQLYTVGAEALTALIPSSISYETASVLPLAISTAAAGLYLKGLLELPLPTKNPKPTGKILFINGVSSSVGSITIQLAIASGLKVIATASSHNFEYAKSLGAIEVYDYNDNTVVDKVVAALKRADEFVGVYDAIASPGSIKLCASVAERLGGAVIAVTRPPPENIGPSSVKAVTFFATSIVDVPEVVEAVWGKWVPEALIDGSLKAVPEALVVGKGLESIQMAMEKQKKGVSAKKIVVSL